MFVCRVVRAGVQVCVCVREGGVHSFIRHVFNYYFGLSSLPSQAGTSRTCLFFSFLSLSIEFYGLESVTGHSIRGGEIGRYAYLHAWSLFFGDGSAALLYSI